MISIIVPVYNAEKYIRETVESVLGQTYTDWELILVDDCSTDGSVAVIEEIIRKNSGTAGEAKEERYRLICLSKDEGGSAARARNAGIKEAKGRYIAFLDADDIWYREKLEKELNLLESLNNNAGFVFTAYEFGDENAKPNGKMTKVPEKMPFRKALSRTVIFTSTVLIDTEVIPKDMIYMPEIKSEDTATWWNILKAGHVAYGLNEPLVIYRRPQNSLSSNKVEALRRIWRLYRDVAKLNWIQSCWYFVRWAIRATFRRVVPRS